VQGKDVVASVVLQGLVPDQLRRLGVEKGNTETIKILKNKINNVVKIIKS
jgi:hypothetical protein